LTYASPYTWNGTHACRFEGVAPGETADRDLELQIPEDMEPSTSGEKYVKCKYHVDVECDVAYAPDIEVHLPITVFAPQPAAWGWDAE